MVCLSLALAAAVSAQTPLLMAKPESVGMSSERLGRIGPAIQAYIDRGEVAGAVTLVARRGKVVHLEAWGWSDIQAQKPLCTDSLFRLASQTKPVTAAAAMILLEQGRFRLDDPIAKYLPEFSDMQVAVAKEDGDGYDLVPAARPMTVRHLLTHTAGMSEGPNGLAAKARRPLIRRPGGLVDLIPNYAKAPLGFQPGEAWQYSPIMGINVVGRLVEVLSGQRLDEFDREHIFEPLGMEDTFYYVPLDRLDRFTVCYQRRPDGSIVPADPADGSSRFVLEGRDKVRFPGAGGLVCAAGDYFRFAQMLLNGGELDGVRILGSKTVELMASPHAVGVPKIGSMTGAGTAFGLGVNVVVDAAATGELTSNGTFSWGGAFGTTFWIDPVEELIGIYMMQLGGHQPLRVRHEYATLVYAAVVD
jgi:CubicO group peptidase (beta-lactamase class C family)